MHAMSEKSCTFAENKKCIMATNVLSTSNQIIVTFDDISTMPMVKKAISLMRGVKSVKTARPKPTCTAKAIERALKDVVDGKVTEWNSVDEMFDTILK